MNYTTLLTEVLALLPQESSEPSVGDITYQHQVFQNMAGNVFLRETLIHRA
jgi:hypothetical protein